MSRTRTTKKIAVKSKQLGLIMVHVGPYWLALVLAGAGLFLPARAQDTTEQIKALREQIEVLDQKVRVLERKQELEAEEAAAKAKDTPQLSIGQSGFVLRSSDTNFVLKIKGVIQLDSRTFAHDNPGTIGNNGFILRRARPIIEGTVFRDFDFQFIPDFGGSSAQIFDAWLNYGYCPELQLKAGKFKTPIGLEQLQADASLPFNERSLATDLVPNRDLGVQLWGEFAGGFAAYQAGVFNGLGDGRNSSNVDFDDDKQVAARVFLQPFKQSGARGLRGLGFGMAGSWGNYATNVAGLPNNNGFTTDGQQLFFAYTNGVTADGDQWRVSPQAYYYFGPGNMLGEYVISSQQVRKGGSTAKLQNEAWQVSAGWVLTGEDAGFNGVVPRHPFDPRAGQWGAWQVVARYAQLNVDRDAFPTFANPAGSATSAAAWSVGLNWWLNRNVRLLASYSHTDFEGGGAGANPPGSVTKQDENVFFTRVQAAF